MTADDLALMIRTALDNAGKTKVPVVPPGSPVSVLPSVILAPADNVLENSNRTLRYGFDVTVMVPRHAQVAQYEQLEELETIVLQSLIPSTVRIDVLLPYAVSGGDGTGDPPAQARVIPITFTSDVDLC